MKKTDCDMCKFGSRHYALDSDNKQIPKDWSEYKNDAPKEVDAVNYWTYFTCSKKVFSITDNCNKFQKSVQS